METTILDIEKLGSLNVENYVLTAETSSELSLFTKFSEFENNISVISSDGMALTLNGNTLTLNSGYRDLTVDMSQFTQDSFLSTARYDATSKKLIFVMIMADGSTKEISVDVSDFVKEYAADGRTLSSSVNDSGETTFAVDSAWLASQISAAVYPVSSDLTNKIDITAFNSISSSLSTATKDLVSSEINKLCSNTQIQNALDAKAFVSSVYTKGEVDMISTSLSSGEKAYIDEKIGELCTAAQIESELTARIDLTAVQATSANIIQTGKLCVDAFETTKGTLTAFNEHKNNADIHVSGDDKTKWNAISALSNYLTLENFNASKSSINTAVINAGSQVISIGSEADAVSGTIGDVSGYIQGLSSYISSHTHVLSNITDFKTKWSTAFDDLSDITLTSTMDDVVGTLVQVVSKLSAGIVPKA